MYIVEVYIHALVTTANVPLMRSGFLPVIPAPVTEYATARKALVNLQSVRKQLSQTVVPVFCDEGVFHMVAHILMSAIHICGHMWRG